MHSTDHTFREVSDSSIASLTGKQVDTVLCTMCAHYMSMKFPGAFPSKKFSAFHCLCTKREEKRKKAWGKIKGDDLLPSQNNLSIAENIWLPKYNIVRRYPPLGVLTMSPSEILMVTFVVLVLFAIV